jgi:hypothetical protein
MVVAISGATTMLLLNRGTEGIVGVGVGALVGILVNCDCDVDGGNIADYIIRRYTGVAVEMMWDTLWKIYRKGLKHRGFLSHFPVISTCIRIAYLGTFYFLIATPLHWLSGIVRIDWPLFLWWCFIGLVLADSAHYGLDKLDEAMGGRL